MRNPAWTRRVTSTTNSINVMPNPFPGLVQATATVQVTVPAKKLKITKAGTNGSIVAVILDESGSMGSCQDATISGFNEFIGDQKTQEGVTRITLNKFDGGRVSTVYDALEVSEVPALDRNTYCPRGSTNLNDAIGETVMNIDSKLHKMKKDERPAVIIAIMTDGEENASRQYTKEQIKELVALAEKKNWMFMFFGADIDAFAASSSIGLRACNTVQYSKGSTMDTFAAASASVGRSKMAYAMGASTESLYSNDLFTAAERSAAVSK